MSNILANLRIELDSTFVFNKVPENVIRIDNVLYVSIGDNFGCLTQISYNDDIFDLFYYDKSETDFKFVKSVPNVSIKNAAEEIVNVIYAHPDAIDAGI